MIAPDNISSDSLVKSVPANLEAERAVLGSLLIDPDALIKVANFLRAEDFYRERHGWIYEAMLALNERREPIDFVTLQDELERREQLSEIGGPAYISDLSTSTPTSIYVDHYARIVERTALLRRLIAGAGKIVELAYDESQDANQVLERAEQIIFGISESRVHRDLTPIHSVMQDVINRLDFLSRNQDTLMGVSTGFHAMDKLLGGFQQSDLIIVAARPGMGKSSLALSVAQKAAQNLNARVAIFSLEMSSEQLVQRLLAMETRIDSHRLRLGQIYDDEWAILLEVANSLANSQVFIDDTPGASVSDIRTKARRLYAEHGLDLLIIDYMQLMTGQSGSRNENRQQEISYISRSLKELARELNVPVVALSQLSRAVESRADKRPMLSDLRESGCLTGDSLVTLYDGQRIPIAELCGKAGFNVFSLNPETLKLEHAIVTNAFCTGEKQVFTLQTQLGRSIRATANHKFLTIEGWKRLDQIKLGERIALPRHVEVNTNAKMSNDQLALLGHMIGVFGCMTYGKSPRAAIYYATSSARLAVDVQTLLLRIGINSRVVRWGQGEKGQDQYHVIVSGIPDCTNFCRSIGAVGAYKTEGIRSVSAFLDGKVANTNRDVLPKEIWRLYVKPVMKENGISHRELHKRIQTAYAGATIFKQNVSRERAAKVAEAIDSTELRNLATSDVYWDQVASIDPDGTEPVYDLTVPDNHNFVANNIIVHNSIEQDADVVMFIYREDYYIEDTDRQNIADIIVAKHRHGSTGTVSLYFRKELTQFNDMEIHRTELDY
ncbi:MAG: replicative DNA helicase [Caldilineaceae bacterium]|nr:replicative DNA helicase [Caldilineaceae bacterium]